VILALVAALEVLFAVARHRPQAELLELAASGDAAERTFALHVLANRGDTLPLGAERIDALLASEHAVEREFAMTFDLTRTEGEARQRAYLEGLGDPDERARCDFFLRHQILRPTLARLRAYLTARAKVD
jgi:hypothetical protein